MSNWIQKYKIFDIYLFLFIFTMINREFLFFGFDPRYILFIMSAALILLGLKNIKEIQFSKIEILLIFFYILLFFSNCCFLINRHPVAIKELKSLNILHMNNFLLLITIILYKKEVSQKKVTRYYKIAMIFLIISFLLVLLHINIPSLFCGTKHVAVYGKDQINLFGGYFRIGGLAEDANYAFLFFFSFIILLFIEGLNISNLLLIVVSFIGMGLSFSKTQVLMLVPAILIYFIYKKIKMTNKIKDISLFVLSMSVFLLPFIMLKLNLFGSMITMANRYSLWNTAIQLIKRNHFLPAGLGGFRFYNYYRVNWLVQSHSSYVQILTELGIICAILYIFVAYFNLKRLKNLNYIILLNFMFFSLTSETLYLQFFVFAMYLLNVMYENEGDQMNQEKGKKILFFVNSLGKGGAERVCANLANGYIQNGYSVDFIVLFDDRSYSKQESYRIFSLGIDANQSKIKVIAQIFLKLKKVNQFIKNSEDGGSYALVTAHLPLSHICTAMSCVGKRCLYVQHISLKSEGKYYNLYKMFYKNKKNVCVSKGLGNEFVHLMNYDSHNIEVVYNPVSIDEIKEKAKEPLVFENKPYFLCVGRLTKQKRFDRAINIFYQGKYYKDYFLVFLGQGEKEEELRQQVKKLGLENRVIFAGWQGNVYQWMKNATLLLHTSEREALPMVLIEALASGTKIVASNCEYGSNEILKDKYSKYIANQNDVEDYIKKINDALTHFEVNSHYEILDECQGENVCKRYLDVYKQMF